MRRAANVKKKSTKKTGANKTNSEKIEPVPAGKDFPIVGLGASAGGLEAFQQFLKKVPPDSGIAFVLVPHLDPNHASMMSDLLRRYTTMEVIEAQDNVVVKPDMVYIIPPKKDIAIHKGALLLTNPEEPRGLRMPIDFFFRSLAEDRGERAIGIILSGTGTDGTMGVRAIREAGGMSMVQDETSAKYIGMPRSAINTGLVDYILPVEKMPEQLISYISRSYPKKRPKPDELKEIPVSYRKVLSMIRLKTGHDFSYYKKSTIFRRIERRMNVHETKDINSYLKYLQEHPEEITMLFKELLIGVTNFFRDAEAFDILKKKGLPAVLGDKPEGYQVRVWVPGCSTGEEVYSIIILLREYMDEVRKEFKIQVFGTDIDEDAISTARSGIYPGNIAIDVNPERLRKYFIREENAYRVRKDIREAAVFAVQNVTKDAPFTKLDILSCRNLLIYLDSDLQSRLMPLFHYSLKPGGLLFLGSSESIGSYMDLFRAFDKKWKFYRRTETPSANNVGAFAGFPWTLESGQREAVPEVRKLRAVSTSELARKVLIENFAPPSVLINSRGEILHVQGKTGKYLEPSQGQASLNIIDMAREGLQFELRSALRSVQQERMETVQRNIRVKTNGGAQVINLKIIPVPDSEQAQGLMLVSFEDVVPVKAKQAEKEKGGRADARAGRVHEIEKELKYTRENLQATIEELQASNEELKSANEELQSTNEELETSKEEMQSVNEELATVNSELQVKIEQLSRAENDMRNLLDSTNSGIIFLDRDLRIKRFTQEATKLINLIHSDIGCPISHIVANLEYEGLDMDARQVLDALVPKEQEVRTRDGHNYLMRIMPYRTVENVIDGVAVTFTDIGRLKEKIGILR